VAEHKEKPSGVKFLTALLIFVITGLALSLLMNYTQYTGIEHVTPVSNEVLKAVKENTEIEKSNEQKLDKILIILEENSKEGR